MNDAATLSLTGNSRRITSNQLRVHGDLLAVVAKHAHCASRRPIPDHQHEVFASLDTRIRASGRRLILDSGCGTGTATIALAHRHPEHLVIGIDKSAARIAQATAMTGPANVCFARADCADIWRLAAESGWPLDRHFLLYPNPWPKAKQLRRRWHAHPAFKHLLALGGMLEVRSNWALYIEEFALALTALGAGPPRVERFVPLEPETPFERKYLSSGHDLHRLRVTIRRPA